MAVSRFWRYRRFPACTLLVLLLLPLELFAEGETTLAQLSIPEGTQVQLRLMHTVSTATARRGDPLTFVVEKNVTVDGVTVVPAGAVAQGSVLSVKRRKILGIGGKLVYGVSFISLSTGETITAQARKVAIGNSRVWRMLAGAAVTALFYMPAAPLFLLTRGANGVALKDTELTATIDCSSVVVRTTSTSSPQDPAQLSGMLQNLPPRVIDRTGREGDMVNLIFVAQQSELEAAFAREGWNTTDPWRPVALWHIAKFRGHDIYMPMAEFYMFGRKQDYGYALPDPNAMIRRRHHIRIWKTQYTMNGVPIWAAAASYDAHLEYGKAGHLVNHNIDPNVDAERDFVGSDIAENDSMRLRYVQSDNPVTEAKTTTGQAYWSDSRLLLVDLHQQANVVALLPAKTANSATLPALATRASQDSQK
jgi:hypothetical protein